MPLNKEKKTNQTYYLPITGGRIIGFIPFPRVLVLCEMQSVSSWIWTRVAVSVFYDDNHYTTGTSYIYIYIYCEWYKMHEKDARKTQQSKCWYIYIQSFPDCQPATRLFCYYTLECSKSEPFHLVGNSLWYIIVSK